ncbi:hypothetical protein ACNJOL_25275, partial [Escherichia coli]
MTQTPLLLAIIFLLVVLVLYIAAIKRIKKIQLELSDSNQKNEEYKSRFADYFNVEEECKKLIEKTEQECSIIKEESLKVKEGANKRGNSSRLTQSFHFFMFEPIFSPVNALN